jgi:hypothetical protein
MVYRNPIMHNYLRVHRSGPNTKNQGDVSKKLKQRRTASGVGTKESGRFLLEIGIAPIALGFSPLCPYGAGVVSLRELKEHPMRTKGVQCLMRGVCRRLYFIISSIRRTKQDRERM